MTGTTSQAVASIHGDRPSTALPRGRFQARTRTSALALALEPRFMFDAAGAAKGGEAAVEAAAQEAADQQTSNPAADDPADPLVAALGETSPPADRTEIVFVDPSIHNYQALLADVHAAAQVVILDPAAGGLTQIADVLSGRSDIDAIHIVSHGGVGEIMFGSGTVDIGNLPDHAEPLSQIGAALSTDGDILLYGCDIGADGAGAAFLDALADLTGADVAASRGATGADHLGGDWVLEQVSGSVADSAVDDLLARSEFDGILALTTVTWTGSDVDLGTAATGAEAGASGTGYYIEVFIADNAAAPTGDTVHITDSGAASFSDSLTNADPGVNGVLTWVIKSKHGYNFDLTSLEVNYGTAGVDQTLQIEGFENGASTGSDQFTISGNTRLTVNIGDELTAGNFDVVDEIRITSVSQPGVGSFIGLNDIVLEHANNAPEVTGIPTDLTVREDEVSYLILDTLDLFDVETDELTLTLTASAGILVATAGDTTIGSVTPSGTGTDTLSFTGSGSNIGTYFNNWLRVHYTSASNASGDNAATIAVSVTDGTETVQFGHINLDITPAQDAPVLDDSASPSLTAIAEDAGDDDGSGDDGDDDATNNANNPGTSVADLVVDGSITDPDGGAVEAIAVIAVDNTNGVWQYSTNNGTNWVNFSGTTGSSVDIAGAARLLDGTLTGASTHLVRFVPDADYNGSATITFRAWDKTSGSAGSTANTGSTGDDTAFSADSDTATVTVNPVNDAPTVSGLPSDIFFLEDTTGALDLWTAGFADIDGDSLTVTLAASAGTLAAGTSGGVTVGGSGTGTLTLAGTTAAINTWLGISSNIQYTPAGDAGGDDAATVTVNVDDGTVNPLLGTVNIDITAQNDAPVLNAGASPTLAGITEDAGDDDGSGADGDDDATSNANNPGTSVAALVVDGSITDVDGSAVEAIAVTAVDNTNGVWQYSTDNGTSWNSFSGTTGGTADLSGTARLLDGTLTGSNTHLVRFVPDADYNGSATITFRAWDKTSGSAGGTADTGSTGDTTPFSSVSDTASVTVTAVNDAPVLGPGTNVVNYTEGGGPIVVFSYITLTDPDTANFASATVKIIGSSVAGEVLSAGVTTPFIASYDAGTYTLTLTGPGTRAELEAALQTVTFTSTSDDPTAGGTDNVRTLEFQVTEDGTAVTSNTRHAQVRITGLNDEPTLTATGTDPTFVEGSAAPGADLFDTVAASTVEANQTVTGMTLTVTNITDGPAEVLRFDGSDVALTHGNAVTSATNGLSVTVSLAGTTATVAFSGASLSADALRTLVDGLAYSNTSDTPTEADRVITVTQLTDDGGTANGGSDTAAPNLQSTATVAATNDAPAIAGDLTIAVTEGGTVTVTTTDLTENDPDDNGTGLTYTVTSSPANGLLELTTNPTVAITSFTQDDLDNGRVVYRHDGGMTTSDSIQVSLADGGENSAAPATATLGVTIGAVNDAPAITGDLAIAVAEGGTVSLTTTDLNEADPDDSGTGLTYTVTAGPANGHLELTTNPTVAIASFTQADLDNGWVAYRHDGSETASDSVRISLADGGEDGATPATGLITITVIADESESDDGNTPVQPQPEPPTADADTAPTPPAPDVTDPAIGPELPQPTEVATSTGQTDPQTTTEIMAAIGEPDPLALDGMDFARVDLPSGDDTSLPPGEPDGQAAPISQTDPLFFGFPLDEVVLYSAEGAELADIDSRQGVLTLVAETTDGGTAGDRAQVLMVMERLGLFADGMVQLSELRGEIGLFGMTLAEMVAALQGEELGTIDSLDDLQSALGDPDIAETDDVPETSASRLAPGAPAFTAQIAGAFDAFDREAALFGAALARVPAAPMDWLHG